MKVIGITGPTGAGKTTALRVLTDLGAEVIDCDAVYHELLAGSEQLRAALVGRFGPGILDGAGNVERKKLGAIVFADKAALSDLNDITHRFICAEVERRIAAARQALRWAAAVDAIALIESGVGEICDVVVGVVAPAQVRVRRIMEREGISEEYARSRVAAQKGEDFFRANCTYLLENGGGETREAFAEKARALFEKILDQDWKSS